MKMLLLLLTFLIAAPVQAELAPSTVPPIGACGETDTGDYNNERGKPPPPPPPPPPVADTATGS